MFSGDRSTSASGDLTFAWSFSDGGSDTGTFVSHTFADDGIFTADLIVTDDEGTADQATKQITINNVAPTVILSGDATFDEGDFEIYDAIVSDPGDDGFTVNVADVDCGTGGVLAINTSNLGGNTIQLTGTGFRFACVFPDGPASPTVQAQVQDTDGAASNLASLAVTVNNVAPDIIIFDGATTANDGGTILYFFEFFDRGNDTVSFPAGFPDCGAGGTLVPGSVLLDIFEGEFECAFPDGLASPTVRVQVSDEDGGTSTIESIQVTVSNVAPTVILSGDATVDEGGTEFYDAIVSDPGDDGFTVDVADVDCGTGGPSPDQLD